MPFGIGSAHFSPSVEDSYDKDEDHDLEFNDQELLDENKTTPVVVNDSTIDNAKSDDVPAPPQSEITQVEEMTPIDEVTESLPDEPENSGHESEESYLSEFSSEIPKLPSIEVEAAEEESPALVKMSAVSIEDASIDDSPVKIIAEIVPKGDDDSLSFGEQGVPDVWRIDAQPSIWKPSISRRMK